MTTELNLDQLTAILHEAQAEAHKAASQYFNDQLGGVDQFACGFAWVRIFEYQGAKINGNTKVGRLLKKAGVRQNWNRTFEMWNPPHFPCQNVDTLEAGAEAAAKVLKEYGFTAYAGSRLD